LHLRRQVKPCKDPIQSKICRWNGILGVQGIISRHKIRIIYLLSGVSLSGSQVKEKLNYNTGRHVYDWLDVLVSLDFLQRDGIADHDCTAMAPETDLFLIKINPVISAGILEWEITVYTGFGATSKKVIDCLPQNETKDGNMNFLRSCINSHEKLQEFMDAMSAYKWLIS